MFPPPVARLSRVWFPSGGIAAVPGVEDAHSKLIRAGLLRQSNAGMFHMLPLGRRVQDKVEALVASHMEERLGKSSRGESGDAPQRTWLTCPHHCLQVHPESQCLPYRLRRCGRRAAAWRRSPPRLVFAGHTCIVRVWR